MSGTTAGYHTAIEFLEATYPPRVLVVGFLLLGVTGALYLVSGLNVPLPGLVLLWVVWAIAFGTAVARRSRPRYPLAMAAVTAAVWMAVVSFGDLVLDWSA